MRARATLMLFGGLFLLLLSLYSRTGTLDRASRVGDTLALCTSALVVLCGLVFLLLSRRPDRVPMSSRPTPTVESGPTQAPTPGVDE